MPGAGRTRTAVAVALLGLLGVPGMQAEAAAPPTFTVTTLLDAPDANPGDGVCASTLPGGACTLRAAVQEASTRAGSTVLLPPGHYRLSIAPQASDEVPGSAQAVDGAHGDLVIDS